jgi:hypothetical protein
MVTFFFLERNLSIFTKSGILTCIVAKMTAMKMDYFAAISMKVLKELCNNIKYSFSIIVSHKSIMQLDHRFENYDLYIGINARRKYTKILIEVKFGVGYYQFSSFFKYQMKVNTT